MKNSIKFGLVFLLALLCFYIDHSSQQTEAAPSEKAIRDPMAVTIQESKEAPLVVNASETDNLQRYTYMDGFYSEILPESVKERIIGNSYPEDCPLPLKDLRYLHVQYIDFEGTPQEGELICHQTIAQDLLEIFYELYISRYPIQSIRLIDDYGADDEASMQANNTSCFNYRTIAGSSRLSNHSQGLAIDINPLYNPYISGSTVLPANALPYSDRTQSFPGKIEEGDLCWQLFTSHGFTWGGSWNTRQDYQHFEKPPF